MVPLHTTQVTLGKIKGNTSVRLCLQQTTSSIALRDTILMSGQGSGPGGLLIDTSDQASQPTIDLLLYKLVEGSLSEGMFQPKFRFLGDNLQDALLVLSLRGPQFYLKQGQEATWSFSAQESQRRSRKRRNRRNQRQNSSLKNLCQVQSLYWLGLRINGLQMGCQLNPDLLRQNKRGRKVNYIRVATNVQVQVRKPEYSPCFQRFTFTYESFRIQANMKTNLSSIKT